MKMQSSSFKHGEMIPTKFTCDGVNISPQLSWSDAPGGVKTFSIVCDDPDAPSGTWVHWVIFNIPAHINELSEAIPTIEQLPTGGVHGINDFGNPGYGGPCPPGGTHRYYFKIYALSEELNEKPGMTKAQLLKAMEGKIMAEGQLMGKYQR